MVAWLTGVVVGFLDVCMIVCSSVDVLMGLFVGLWADVSCC